MSAINDRLKEIRTALFVPKAKSHKHYKYRTESDILIAVYPLLEDGESINIINEPYEADGWHYMSAQAAFLKGGEIVTHRGYAREPENPNQMSTQQATGASITFARKYALTSLFMLTDDALDPDSLQSGGLPEFINEVQQDEIKALFKKKKFTPERILKFLELAQAETLQEVAVDKFDNAKRWLEDCDVSDGRN